MTRIAIVDDYLNAALEVADWSSLRNHTEVHRGHDFQRPSFRS
jgi:hypothetical protein